MSGGNLWVGNFEEIWRGLPSSVHADLGPRFTLVVAGGAGYIIDAVDRRLVQELAIDIQHVWFQQDLEAFIISNGLWFEAFGREARLWRSPRLSWDGIRNVERLGLTATGEAYDPTSRDGDWVPFSLDLASGDVRGGSYGGPPM